MIDHVVLTVSDLARSLRFYERLLAPLDVGVTARDLDAAEGARVGLGQGGVTGLWLTEAGDPQAGVAIGIAAATRRQVDEFHADAVDYGARGIVAAAVRGAVGPDYYAAGATDPDNNRVEAVRDGEFGLALAPLIEDGGDRLADAAALARWEAGRAEPERARTVHGSQPSPDVDFSIVAARRLP